MPRYIDADKLITRLKAKLGWWSTNNQIHRAFRGAYADSILIVRDAPTVEAEPVRHGRWIKVIGDDYECSNCKAAVWARKANPISEHKYCWRCGAKMDKEEK